MSNLIKNEKQCIKNCVAFDVTDSSTWNRYIFFLNQYTAKKNKENTAKQVDSDKKHTTTYNIYANNR